MFQVIWLIAYISAGVPHIDKYPDKFIDPVDKETCIALIAEREARMTDWARGVLRAPLEAPVAVRGECAPVEKQAFSQPKDTD